MYFPTRTYDACGDVMTFAGQRVTGWKITFRRGHGQRPLQRQRFKTASRFGALRQLLREGRLWHGKVYALEIVSIEPVVEGIYEYPEED